MGCENCGHMHQMTEQAVRYTTDCRKVWHTMSIACDCGGTRQIEINRVESTLMVCSEPGCQCYELDPTDYEDRVALIAAGEIDGD